MLYTDSAAAGLGLGLLGCGSNDGKTGEMLAYAHDTQHEKITRGLAHPRWSNLWTSQL